MPVDVAQKKLGQSKSRERMTTLGAISQFIERITGFDLDGDGTVGGDIIAEVLIIF